MNPTALTSMVDRVFGDRYRIEELIGVGAISAVYSAFDDHEDRWVAIKLFDETLGEDPRFVERLLDAVEHAAVLGHRNIAEIFDWGIDGGPYIVSELCEGGSLAAALAAGHTLAPSQALVMALECSRALDHGHQSGVIHRNITPSNVLFSADESVRLTDYGLSQILSEAPLSRSDRALENVRYASPEQARGRPVNEATDLYSLALVVNEAVSGSQPEVADTVVGTLMARAESVALLDASLEGLLPPLERCGRVDPSDRPEAEELSIALLAAAETMARPEALPLVGIDLDDSTAAASDVRVSGGTNAQADAPPLDGDGSTAALAAGAPTSDVAAVDGVDDRRGEGRDHDGDDFDISRLGPLDETDAFGDSGLPRVEISDEDAAPAGGSGLDSLESVAPVFASVPGLADETSLDVPEQGPGRRSARRAYEEVADDADDRLPWWPLALLGVLVGLVGAGVYFFTLQSANDTAQVPDLVGLQFDEAQGRIASIGWQVERLENRQDGSIEGSIIAQEPVPGADLGEGETVRVTVSLGNQMVEIPREVVGLDVEQAASRLGAAGLTVGTISEENSEAFAAGLVIGLDEPTTQKPLGDGVSLRVSLGPEDRAVPPNLVGMTIGDATSALAGLRLQAVAELAFSPGIEAGVVLDSIPGAGQIVAADSAVTLIVSDGPEPVVMPDIVGLTLEEAIEELEALGLVFTFDIEGTAGEEVIGSLPPIGATTDVGTEVTIILADPEEDEDDE